MIEFIKNIARKILRTICILPFRGRHRLIKSLGEKFKPKEFIEIIENNKLKLQIDHRVFFSRLVYYGMYENELIRFLNKKIRPSDIVLEPGANIGYISSVILGRINDSGHLYSFEPSKICYNQIANHNDLSAFKNFTLFNAAISDVSGEDSFSDSPNVIEFGYACLSKVNTPKDSNAYTIPTYSVDDFCKRQNIESFRFLKLDVEGAELLALIGAEKMIRNKKIDYILIETALKKNLNDYNDKIFKIMSDSGYSSYELDKKGELRSIDLTRIETEYRKDIIWTSLKN